MGEPSSIVSRTLHVGLLKRLPVFSTRELGDGQTASLLDAVR
jgi:hypothetical protein